MIMASTWLLLGVGKRTFSRVTMHIDRVPAMGRCAPKLYRQVDWQDGGRGLSGSDGGWRAQAWWPLQPTGYCPSPHPPTGHRPTAYRPPQPLGPAGAKHRLSFLQSTRPSSSLSKDRGMPGLRFGPSVATCRLESVRIRQMKCRPAVSPRRLHRGWQHKPYRLYFLLVLHMARL